jgi:hypothetical protein
MGTPFSFFFSLIVLKNSRKRMGHQISGGSRGACCRIKREEKMIFPGLLFVLANSAENNN